MSPPAAGHPCNAYGVFYGVPGEGGGVAHCYARVGAQPGVHHLACWVHARRRFVDAAAPVIDPKQARARGRVRLYGDLPSPLDTRAGLRFLQSKLVNNPEADQYRPKMIEVAPGHFVAEHDEERAA